MMYDFHYTVIKEEFNEKVKLLYQDTDSYVYEFRDTNFYEFMKKNPDYFDTSDYPKYRPQHCRCLGSMCASALYSDKNKKVIGKFKDELTGVKMLEFIGLRSKMYSYRTDNSIAKKLKGIKKAVLKKEISFDDYKNCLMNRVFS